jgi:hypothetical protein
MGTASTEQFVQEADAERADLGDGPAEGLLVRFFRALAPPDEWLAAQQDK